MTTFTGGPRIVASRSRFALASSAAANAGQDRKAMNELLATISERLQEVFSPDALAQKLSAGLINLLVALAIFAAFILLWLLLRRIVGSAFRRGRGDATTESFVQTALKYGLFTAGIVTALDSAGIQTTAVLTSLGIAGVALGFAAKDALSNLVSGVLIFLDRPFVIGDLVEINNQYGRVDRITLRSTRIVTRDGKMLAVPNTEIINSTVASYTNFPHLRLDIALTVGVGEDIARVRSVLLGLIDPAQGYMEEPPARVVVTALNDYNIALELQAWIADERKHIEMRFALREQVFNALNDAGVDMPFETLRLINPAPTGAETQR